MKQGKKLISFLLAAVMTAGTVLQCAGIAASAAEQQNGTAEAVPELSATGTGGVGEVLADSISKETARLQKAEGCNIFSIVTESNKATVHFSASEDCKLVVGVYTDLYEDGYEKMVASAVTDVKAGEETAELTFSSGSMPEYYVLKAYLIGSDGKLLSEEYVDQTYTKDIQKLMDSDIHSYEGYEVLNLDDKDDTNFVVYKKDVKVLNTTETENILIAADDAAGVYTLQNVSAEIHEGDVVSVQNGSPDVVIFRVKSMETDGDLTTFEADMSMKAAEAFSYIKVEMQPEDFAEETTATEATTTTETTTTVTTTTVTTTTVVTAQTEDTAPADETAQTETTAPAAETEPPVQKPAQSRPLEKNEAVPDAADEGGWSGSKQLELETAVKEGDIPIPGIDASYSLSNFKFSLDLNYAVMFDYYCTETHTKSALYIESEVNLGLTIEAKATVYCPIPGCSFNVDKFGVKFKLGFFLKLELNGYVAGSAKLTAIWDSTGFHPDAKFNFSASAEIYAGIAFKAECEVFGAEVEAEIGAGARAAFSGAESHPVCSVCMDIELSVEGNFEVKAGISFWGIDWGFGTSGSVSYKLSDAYWSDKLGFGLGSCPNKKISGTSGTGTPGSETHEQPADGLTDEQREYLVFSGAPGGYAVSVKPSHVEDIESIEIPAEYYGRPVVAVGTGRYSGRAGCGCGSSGGSYYVNWSREGQRTSDAGFEGCTNLKSIRLPETIQYINAYSFAGCTALENINLPDSVVRIEYCAFIMCAKMKLDRLPSNISEIGEYAFVECDRCFETLILPPSLKSMGRCVFANCDGIRYAKMSLRAIPSNTLYYCAGLKKLVIGEPTVSIKRSAFYGNENLTEVILPDSVRIIGNEAFQNCQSLRVFNLPDNLMVLGESALEWTSVPALKIPPLLKKINGDLLYADRAIKKIVLPENIEYIDFSAFQATYGLSDITILNRNAEFAELRTQNGVLDSSYSTNSKTIYGYSGSTTQEFCEKYGFRFKALDAQSAPVVTPVVTPENDPPQTMTFKDLEPNTLYNFYDLLGEEFTAENLLFLSQGMSDENGTLTVWYRPVKDDTDANRFVRCYETEPAVPQVLDGGFGDANMDGQIDVSDAVLIMRFIAEDRTAVIKDKGVKNADVNHSGNVDLDDVTRILKYIAKLIKALDE